MRFCKFCSVLFFIVLPCSLGAAAEVVLSNDESQVHSDFARMAVADSEAKEQAFYFDVNGLVERTTLSGKEAEDVGKAANELVRSVFRLTPTKSDAKYIIQMRVDRLTNYAIRNPRRMPSSGPVMISLCRLPINDVASDCGNLTFFYFGAFRGVDALQKTFPVWTAMTLRPAQ